MATVQTVSGDVVVDGSLRVTGSISPRKTATSLLVQRDNSPYVVDLTTFRVWDAIQTMLPATSATDDLGLYTGTFATNAPMIKTYDVKNAGAVSLRARVLIPIPAFYVDGETQTLRIVAGMGTTVASTTATIDVEAYLLDDEGGISADLCTTSAQDINSTTMTIKDFAITESGVRGKTLDVRITIAVNDSGTGTAVIGQIGSVKFLADSV
jgi:hypothetical protein